MDQIATETAKDPAALPGASYLLLDSLTPLPAQHAQPVEEE